MRVCSPIVEDMARALAALTLSLLPPFACGGRAPARPQDGAGAAVLVYTRTLGYRHASIEDGVRALTELGETSGFEVHAVEDPEALAADALTGYGAVVFLSTTGDVLDRDGEAALRAYVEGGGGFAGVHAAADTEYEWPWYGELLGTWFRRHPAPQEATVRVVDPNHPSTTSLPTEWVRFDEWYDFTDDPSDRVHVLAVLEEASYSGGSMGASHPIAWYREVGEGRSWYTAMGHTAESYEEEAFRRHLLGGVLWAAGWEEGVPAR